MKLLRVLALYTLSTIVRGWVTYLQPIALSIGAALTALYHDTGPILDIQPIKLSKWFSVHKQSKEGEEEVFGEEFDGETFDQNDFYESEFDPEAAKKEMSEYT